MSSRYRATLTRCGPDGFPLPVRASWQALKQSTETPTPFADLEFIRLFGKSMGLTPTLAMAADDRGTVEAGAVLYEAGVGPYTRAVVPAFIQYTPFLFARPPSPSANPSRGAPQAVLQEVRRSYAGAALHTLPGLVDVRFASWDGWRVSPLYTYRLPLDAREEVDQEWSGSARRAFRKHSVDFRVEEDATHGARILALCRASYERKRRRFPGDPARLKALVDALAGAGLARVFTATPMGSENPAAGIVVLHDHQSAHYWIAGSQPGPSMTVLLAHVLQRLAGDGIRLFDFVGANTRSIAEFKRKFGPSLVSYFRFEYVSARGLRLIDWARRIKPR